MRDNGGESGSWIQTYTGRQFWPLNPNPVDVDIEDIAHALSMLCRFNGHSTCFYSVAEHSVHVSKILPPEHQLWGLMHDAAEAYLSDIPRPLKRTMHEFQATEEKVLEAIAERFDLGPGPGDEVIEADHILLATEKALLMADEPAPWSGMAEPLNDVELPCLGPSEAKEVFLVRFEELAAK